MPWQTLLLWCLAHVVSGALATPSVVLGPEFESESFRRQVFENGEVPEGLMLAMFPKDEELNRHLKEDLLFLQQTAEEGEWNAPWTNRNSWRSPPGLHNSTEFMSFPKLKSIVDETLRTKLDLPHLELTGLFGKIDGSSSVGAPHDHITEVTGIYYVDVGDSSEDNGALLWFPPDYTRMKKQADGKKVKTVRTVPQNGMLLIWPGPLFHQMPAYTSDRPRMSVVLFISDPTSKKGPKSRNPPPKIDTTKGNSSRRREDSGSGGSGEKTKISLPPELTSDGSAGGKTENFSVEEL
uniref:Prolyl 4-hydroxylase alpha subunit Fe(2+) 2OG dioxygenase domain-containing protein n=1 Tax=Chromera velia CCMP2878 TaxID=1169474 RepID=A0A0G4FCT2_9ALVE|eukprot:Cvel_16398.t1-p1 / transcript=Cvel_16398.t1 / gene=Cvel_16398 / organism=Chromera_velia_CCMP2878 / gene_product=hypothetical protein / transcript_product=hypothetical protein / location=Cvel_scaffold1262:24867-25745(-) / protein_length=293 / sequence_SO=supercontig / SO=protein_coding / is_pseudo=false